MDPRALIGPTLLVFMLLVATFGALFLFEPVEENTLQPEDYYSMSKSELKAKITEQMGVQMNRQLLYYGVIGVLLCVVPMGKTNRLTRGVILAGIGLVGRFVTGDQAGSLSNLVAMCVLGGILLVVLFVAKHFSKMLDNGKRPAIERWSPRRNEPMRPDDPETLAKLDRLRAAAAGPPPVAS